MDYKIDSSNSNLIITATDNDIIKLRQLLNDENVVEAERYVVNHIGMRQVRPEENGDLTSAMIMTDGLYEWWDSSYAVRSFVDTLIERGLVAIPFARSHRWPVTIQEATKLLRKSPITIGLWATKYYYTYRLKMFSIYPYQGLQSYEFLMLNFSEGGDSYRISNNLTMSEPPYLEFVDTNIVAPFVEENGKPKFVIEQYSQEEILQKAKELWVRYDSIHSILKEYESYLVDEYQQLLIDKQNDKVEADYGPA